MKASTRARPTSPGEARELENIQSSADLCHLRTKTLSCAGGTKTPYCLPKNQTAQSGQWKTGRFPILSPFLLSIPSHPMTTLIPFLTHMHTQLSTCRLFVKTQMAAYTTVIPSYRFCNSEHVSNFYVGRLQLGSLLTCWSITFQQSPRTSIFLHHTHTLRLPNPSPPFTYLSKVARGLWRLPKNAWWYQPKGERKWTGWCAPHQMVWEQVLILRPQLFLSPWLGESHEPTLLGIGGCVQWLQVPVSSGWLRALHFWQIAKLSSEADAYFPVLPHT